MNCKFRLCVAYSILCATNGCFILHGRNMRVMAGMETARATFSANSAKRAASAKKKREYESKHGFTPMSVRKDETPFSDKRSGKKSHPPTSGKKGQNTPMSVRKDETPFSDKRSGKSHPPTSGKKGQNNGTPSTSLKPRSLWVDEHGKENTPASPSHKQISSKISQTMRATRHMLAQREQLTQDDFAGEAKRLHGYFLARTVREMSVPDFLYSLKIMLELDRQFDKDSKVRLFAQSGQFTLSQHREFLIKLDCDYLKTDKKNDLFLKLLNAVRVGAVRDRA